MVTQCIYDQYFQNWYGSVNASSTLEVVKCINKVFLFEKYLSCIKTDSYRIALARLRCSAHVSDRRGDTPKYREKPPSMSVLLFGSPRRRISFSFSLPCI